MASVDFLQKCNANALFPLEIYRFYRSCHSAFTARSCHFGFSCFLFLVRCAGSCVFSFHSAENLHAVHPASSPAKVRKIDFSQPVSCLRCVCVCVCLRKTRFVIFLTQVGEYFPERAATGDRKGGLVFWNRN